MKRFILSLILLAGLQSAFAQLAVQANYNFWIPTDKYNSEVKLGFIGANLELKKVVDDYITLSVGAGFNQMAYESVRIDRVERPAEGFSDNAVLQFIPITVGADVFFNTDKVRPFLDIDLGCALARSSGDNLPDTEMKVNAFLSPGIGVAYKLSDAILFSGVVKQNIIVYNYDNRPEYKEAFTAVGINLGLTFGF